MEVGPNSLIIMNEESQFYDEVIDEDYQPTADDIEDYAKFLGAELPDDRDLLYIAKEGLLAPLPAMWKPYKTNDQEIYYFNTKTGETQWEHPCDERYRKVMQDAKHAKRRRGGGEIARNTGKPPLSAVDIIDKASKMKKRGTIPKLGAVDDEDKRTGLEEQFQEEVAQMRDLFADQRRALKQNSQAEQDAMEAMLREKQAEDEMKLKRDADLQVEKVRQNVAAEFDRKFQAHKALTDEQLRKETAKLRQEFQDRERAELEALRKTQPSSDDEERSQAELTSAQQRFESLKLDIKSEESKLIAAKQEHKNALAQIEEDYNRQLARQKEVVEAEYSSKMRHADQSKTDSKTQAAIERELADLEIQHKAKIRLLKSDFEDRLAQDRQRLHNELETEAIQLKAEATVERPSIDTGKEQDLAAFKQQIEQERRRNIDEYKRQLETQLKDERRTAELRRRQQQSDIELQNQLQEEAKADVQSLKKLIKDIQIELNSKDSDLAEARHELKGRTDMCNRLETRLSKGLLVEQSHRQSANQQSPHRIDKLEAEFSDLRNELTSNAEVSEGQSALYLERQELKAIQKRLEERRSRWRAEVRSYKHNPSGAKKAELAQIKQILDKQAAKLNDRIKELKQAEDYFMPRRPSNIEEFSDDEFAESELSLLEEVDKPAFLKWVDSSDEMREYGVARPRTAGVTNYSTKLGLYQRHLNRLAVNRDYMKDAMSRHNAWLSNMRDEFSRALSAPKSLLF